ncbi:MAG: hypothetical protein K2W96_10440 [Gemmataceae bacterium]|nr:hypothetical protein [Gemmataceae bacterium]
MDNYPTRYADARGGEDAVISNDGEWLRMRLRGVDLEGRGFDGFSPVAGTDPGSLARLPLYNGYLCLEFRTS